MKNNPFVIWGLPPLLMNRKEEQRIILTFINHIADGQSWVLLIAGAAGTGKSTLLKWAQKEAERQKCITSFINVPSRSGKEMVITELKAGIGGLLRELEEKEEAKKGSAKSFIKTDATDFMHLAKSARRILGKRPIILIINDFDKLKNAQNTLEEINRAAESEVGIGVILSSSKRLVPSLGNMLINLGAVGEQDFFDYVEKITKAKEMTKVGDECLRAAYKDGGGNPKLLQFMLWYLYENTRESDRIITKAHYESLRRAILAALGNEWFGQLYADASEEEKRILKELAKAEQMTVTELAKTLGKKQGPTATLLLRLLERGDVVKVKRGAYKLFAPLYASFISER